MANENVGPSIVIGAAYTSSGKIVEIVSWIRPILDYFVKTSTFCFHIAKSYLQNSRVHRLKSVLFKKEFFCHIMYLLFIYQSSILYYVVFNKCKISYLQK